MQSQLAGGGQNKVSGGGSLPLVDLPLIEDKPVMLAARATTADDATVQTTALWQEWW